MKLQRSQWLCSVLVIALMLVPVVPASSDNGRTSMTIRHISTFGNGSSAATLDFTSAGTNNSLYITLPNGATVLSAKMNVEGLPTTDGGTDYPENVSIDVDGQYPPEYEFNRTWYSSMGRQTIFSNGASAVNVNIPPNGGTNTTASIRVPKKATVTSAQMNVTYLQGGAGNINVAIENAAGSWARDSLNNDPVYSIQSLCQAQGWTSSIVVGTDLNTAQKISQYQVVITGDSGYSDNDWATWQSTLPNFVQNGGGFIGIGWMVYNSGLGSTMDACLPVKCGGSGYESAPGNMNILPNNHPITWNVNNFPVYSYVETAVNGLDPGATALVNTPAGKPGVVSGDISRGRGVWIGPIAFADFQGYQSAYYYTNSDFRNLLANAIGWAASSKLTCSLDIGNDGNMDWSKTFNGNESIPDVTSQINAYVAAAPPNGTDFYGNQYVNVPILVSSNTSGVVQLNNLSLTYQYTATVEPNSAGNLAQALNAVLPDSFDGRSTKINLSVFSAHAGKLNLSAVSIDYQPPQYAPIIDSRSPDDIVVVMNENQTQHFEFAASDRLGYPLTVTWYLDGVQYLTDTYSLDWFADYMANGTYDLTATVANDVMMTSTSWTVIVKNVNRLPVIGSFSPSMDVRMDENTSKDFALSATDPDGEPLSYAWRLDGNPTADNRPSYRYSADYASAGKHDILVDVSDTLGGTTPLLWTVTVNDSNAAPELTGWTPAGDTVVMNEMESRDFTVSDITVDKDPHSYKWLLDGTNTTTTGKGYSFSTDYNSSGSHLIAVEVSDGKSSVKKTWNVTVNDVNRPPVAIIDSPLPAAEFMEGDAIVLSGASSRDPDGDALNLSWYEGTVLLGTGMPLTMRPSKGTHVIQLSVNDGKTNGKATAQTVITVRYVQFSGQISIPPTQIVERKTVTVTVFLANKGDGSASNVSVAFKVDGQVLLNRTIEKVTAGGEYRLEFQWTTVKGDHVLSVDVHNIKLSSSVTASKTVAPKVETSQTNWLVVILIVVIVAMGAAIGVLALRGSRKPGGPGGYTGTASQPPAPEPARWSQSAPPPGPQTAPRESYQPPPPPPPPQIPPPT